MLIKNERFDIFFFLYREAHTKKKLRYSLVKIANKFKIKENVALKHLDFLEYKKYLIRDWKHVDDPKTGYQMIKSGDSFMDELMLEIEKKLIKTQNQDIKDILVEARKKTGHKRYEIIYDEGKKYQKELPEILGTVYDEFKKYLETLWVFKISISPKKLDVRKSEKTIKVTGSIQKPYQKQKGKIHIRIKLHGGVKWAKTRMHVAFAKGVIDGSVSFSSDFRDGAHDLVAYYQLKGERPPIRWNAYAKTEPIKIKIISNNTG